MAPELSPHSLSATQDWQVLRLPLTVEVQAFVLGLQEFATVPTMQAASLAAVQATHWLFAGTAASLRQTFLSEICLQSASAEHGPQVLVVVLHSDAAAVLQSALERQATQVLVDVLHWGLVVSLQSVLERQPTQLLTTMSQTVLVGSLQSAEVTHSTQVFASVLHAGLAAE
jgi:hypothetical protein